MNPSDTLTPEQTYNPASMSYAPPALPQKRVRYQEIIDGNRPKIGDYTRANHDHTSVSEGGLLGGDAFTTAFKGGWISLPATLTAPSGYNKGRKHFTLPSSASLAATLSPGMRMRLDRSTAPPTQCADLESGSAQYASLAAGSVAGITFTGAYTAECWLWLESYGATKAILARFSSAVAKGFWFGLLANGRIRIQGNGATAAADTLDSYEAVPLGRWVHIAATLNIGSSTGAIYIDGQLIDSAYTNNGADTAIVQAGPLQIGAYDGALNPLDGKVAEVRLWNTTRTATEIQDNMYQQLATVPAACVGYWKLDGNFNDSSANANNLAGQNGAVATTVSNPMNSTEYAIVLAVTSSSVTVFTGTDSGIPSSFTNVYYSTVDSPFGFPRGRNKWIVESVYTDLQTISIGAFNAFFASNAQLAVPPGDWMLSMNGTLQGSNTVGASVSTFFVLASSTPQMSGGVITSGDRITNRALWIGSQTAAQCGGRAEAPVSISTYTLYTIYGAADTGGGTVTWLIRGDQGVVSIIAECAYV